MTIVQFINFLHGCGLDVLALGLRQPAHFPRQETFPKTQTERAEDVSDGRAFSAGNALVCPLVSPRLPRSRPLFGKRGAHRAARLFRRRRREAFRKVLPRFLSERAKRDERGRAAANFRFCGKRMRGKGREVIPPTASKRLFSESRSREERTKFFSRPRE